MSVYVPTTRVKVLRGTTTDVYGDPVDTSAEVATGLPAAVAEDRQRSFLASEQRGGVVEVFTIRLRPNADVREDDRLVDDDGATYQVQAVSNPPGVIGMADVRVTAVRTGTRSESVND